jgi:hypothetical protein
MSFTQSQPTEDNRPPPPPELTRSLSVTSYLDPRNRIPLRANRLSPEEIQQKANEILEFTKNTTIVEDNIISKDNAQRLYYFIGRLNPPHPGHIETLASLIREAQRSDPPARVLILLGNGPAVEYEKNPIDFDLKSKIIKAKLAEKGIKEQQYTLQNMRTPFTDIPAYIHSMVDKLKDLDRLFIDDKVEILHYVGGKDEDATKLEKVLEIADKIFSDYGFKEENITTRTVPIPPVETETGEAMSATAVRKAVYDALNTSQSIDEAVTKFMNTSYGVWYGVFSPELISQINSVKERADAERNAREIAKAIALEKKIAKEEAAAAKKTTLKAPIKSTRSTRIASVNEGLVPTKGGRTKKQKQRKSKRRNVYKTRTKRNKRRTKKRY